MGKKQQDYTATLQNIVDQFLDIQISLEILTRDSKEVLGRRDRDDLILDFDPKGQLRTVQQCPPRDLEEKLFRERLEDSFGQTNEDNCRLCEDAGKSVIEQVNSLYEFRLCLEQLLASLPNRVHELLSGVRGSNWPSHVRRYCLVPLNYWPRLPSRQVWQPDISRNWRPAIPRRLDWLLEYIEEVDPTTYWQQICRRVDSYIDDVVAIAPEVNASVDVEKDGPCHPRYWRQNGEVINGTMQIGAWKMVKHLWKQTDRVASFDELKVPVYDDAEHIADDSAFGSLRKAANKFFRGNDIPYSVSLSKTTVSILLRE